MKSSWLVLSAAFFLLGLTLEYRRARPSPIPGQASPIEHKEDTWKTQPGTKILKRNRSGESLAHTNQRLRTRSSNETFSAPQIARVAILPTPSSGGAQAAEEANRKAQFAPLVTMPINT